LTFLDEGRSVINPRGSVCHIHGPRFKCACGRDGTSVAVCSSCLESASRIDCILARVVSTGAVPKEGIDPWAGDSR